MRKSAAGCNLGPGIATGTTVDVNSVWMLGHAVPLPGIQTQGLEIARASCI
jgi:hypothetical protein